jgi:hypothetical protein
MWVQERLNIIVLLGIENHKNSEKKVCFYWEFRSIVPAICKSQFSVEHEGRSDILQHIKKRKHAIAAETKSWSKK